MLRTALLSFLFLCAATAGADEGPRYIVREAGKAGYIDSRGRIVISPAYDDAGQFFKGIAPVKIGGLWGYLKETGEMLVAPQLTYASPFAANGWAYVTDASGKPRWVSEKGELRGTPPPSARSIPADANLLFPWEEPDGTYGYVDHMEQTVIPARFEMATEFSEDLAAVREGGLWGYIDRSGGYVLEPRFEEASSFENGRAVVKLPEGYTVIGKNGEAVLSRFFPALQHYSEGLAAARETDDGMFGYVNPEGTFVISPQFDYAFPFALGRANVCRKGFCGFIDTTGAVTLPLRFSRVSYVDGKVFAAWLAESQYYFSPEGRLIYAPVNRRALVPLLLYLLPIVLPVLAARLLVSFSIPRLRSSAGEELREKNFLLIRRLGRIRFAHVLLFLAVFLFTNAQQFFSWLIAETVTAFCSRLLPPAGLPNPFPFRSTASAFLSGVSGTFFLLILLLVTAALLRGSWIRVEQEVFNSQMTAKRFYSAILRAQVVAVAPAFALILLVGRYPKLSELGFGLSVIYLVMLALLSPLLFRLSNKRAHRTDERLTEIAAELQKASGISLASISVLDEPTGRIANAFATGLLPGFRRVWVTQPLLDRCDRDELSAIIAHELGHMKHHDVGKRLIVGLAALWLTGELVRALEKHGPFPELPSGGEIFLWLLFGLPVLTVLVGWRARKGEYRADRYAAELVGSPSLVAQALRKIHQESAIPSTWGKWHRFFLGHPSLREREEALSRLSEVKGSRAPQD